MVDADGLFERSKELAEEENYQRADVALDRCLEVEPANGTLAARIFLGAILYRDFDRVFQCFNIMNKIDNKYYQHDQNFWLVLLSYVTELPDEYKERVKNLSYEDMLVFDDDSRYTDVDLVNKIREMALNREFSEDAKLVRETGEFSDKRLYACVTFRLLNLANFTYYNRRSLYADLIDDENYIQLVNLLNEDSEKWGLSQEEQYVLAIANEMVFMREKQRLPKIKSFSSISFDEAIKKRNYMIIVLEVMIIVFHLLKKTNYWGQCLKKLMVKLQ